MVDDDTAHNRQAMPETAKLIAHARRHLAEFGPLRLVYAQENGYEIGIADEIIATGRINPIGASVEVVKTKSRRIGNRAMPK